MSGEGSLADPTWARRAPEGADDAPLVFHDLPPPTRAEVEAQWRAAPPSSITAVLARSSPTTMVSSTICPSIRAPLASVTSPSVTTSPSTRPSIAMAPVPRT